LDPSVLYPGRPGAKQKCCSAFAVESLGNNPGVQGQGVQGQGVQGQGVQGQRMLVGQLAPRFDDVARIAVLRGAGLGDLLLTLPAVESLAATYPDAEITLLGTSVARALFAGRPSPFAVVEELPVRAGVRDGLEVPAATDAFVARMRDHHFDLAVQLHGGGRNSNPFVLELGARHTVGCATPEAEPLERTLPYAYHQNEVTRALEVVALAGAPPVQLEPRLRLSEEEVSRRRRRRPPSPLIVIHPGATDPRRRWPADRFGQVGAALAGDGAQVVVIGDDSEAALGDDVVRDAVGAGASRQSVRSTAGRLSMTELVSLLLDADLFVGNDSGPRHVAGALGLPTVSIFWIGNLVNFGPLTRSRHRVHLGWTTACPTCGRDAADETAERCKHNPSFVAQVSVGAVLQDVRSLLADA
jgi:ADP-heptose:LPS heptosyltransferase